jgi:hypothetical protein
MNYRKDQRKRDRDTEAERKAADNDFEAPPSKRLCTDWTLPEPSTPSPTGEPRTHALYIKGQVIAHKRKRTEEDEVVEEAENIERQIKRMKKLEKSQKKKQAGMTFILNADGSVSDLSHPQRRYFLQWQVPDSIQQSTPPLPSPAAKTTSLQRRGSKCAQTLLDVPKRIGSALGKAS